MDNPSLATSDDPQIRLNAEALSRLWKTVAKTIGANSGWTRGLEQQITTLQRGFKVLATRHSKAIFWHQALSDLLVNKPEMESTESQKIRPLGMLLQLQPILMPRAETEYCLSLAAIIFAAQVSDTHVSDKYIAGLEQLFRSNRPHWQQARRVLAIGEPLPIGDTSPVPEVVTSFLASTKQLEAGGIYFPDLLRPQIQAGATYPVDFVAGNNHVTEDPAQTKSRKSSAFQVEPCEQLFEFQVVQQEQEPTLNHYLIGTDWNSQTDSEFRDASRILVNQLLSPEDPKTAAQLRLHAACRFLSELTQLSIETLASLPMYRRGTMHVDLKCGLIRRDITVVAPRIDRAKGSRWLRRWLRTPIPPEILNVLRMTASECPTAKTIGDLMVCAGLTPKLCHQLMNHDRRESRVHESLRVARSLQTFLLANGVHPSIISRVFGVIKVMPLTHHYYLALDQKSIHEAINLWCHAIGLASVDMPHTSTLIGSPKVPSFEDMARAFHLLQDQNNRDRMSITSRSSLDDVIQFHNSFVCRYILQLFWAEGARCQKLSSITTGMLFAGGEHVVISDRDSDRYAQWRVCPLPPTLQRSRQNFVAHLHGMVRWLQKRGEHQAANAMTRIVDGRDLNAKALPLLFRQRDSTLTSRSVTRSDLMKFTMSSPIAELNEPRHFLITELDRREVAPIAINAQVGHHHTGAPPFGVGSGMSIAEFSTYMMAVLERLHSDLGLLPLVGLGVTDSNRLKLPKLSLPIVVPPPENLYLAQRLAAEDFNPPDIFFAEEDCPLSAITLPARNALLRLRDNYLKSDLVTCHPWGGVCFCLIAFDLVLNLSELEQFFKQLVAAAEVSVGHLTGVEVFNQDEPLPVGQCLMSQYSVDALKVARTKQSGATFIEALGDLEAMALSLDPVWPKSSGDATARRLQSMAAHLSMVDLPSISRFSMIHKSPFIPMSDIRRIVSGQTTQIDPATLRSQPTTRSSEFRAQIKIVEMWANKDAPKGEYSRRASGLVNDLAKLEAEGQIDEIDELLHEFLRAELGRNPPYRRLQLHILLQYLKVQRIFFAQVRNQGELPRTPEDWTNFLGIFVNSSNDEVAGAKRWAGIHIGAWLMAKGYAVPQALVQGNRQKVNYKPHLSVYVTQNDIEKSIDLLQHSNLRPPLKEWLQTQLRIQRGCVLRPAEIRFLQAQHMSLDGRHIHITTSGHIHLKTPYSRGLVSVPPPLINYLLAHKERRSGSPDGMSASMFVPAGAYGYADFDQMAHAARSILQDITGRSDLRLYDFRACAITDIIFDIHGTLLSLAGGQATPEPKIDTALLTTRYSRGAVAAREARQSSVVTTLRYYYLGGIIENRSRLDALQEDLKPSASYLAAVQGKSSAAILAQRYRVAHGATARINSAEIHAQSTNNVTESRPNFESFANSQHTPGRSLLLAGLLTLGGLDLKPAADAAEIHPKNLEDLLPGFATAVAKVGITSLHQTAVESSSSWFPMLEKLSNWAYMHRHALREFTNQSPKIFRMHGSKLSFSNHAAVLASSRVWTGLQSIGFSPLLIYGKSVPPSERTVFKDVLLNLGIRTVSTAIERQKYAAMRFNLCAKTDPIENMTETTFSNHQTGKAGRLVVATMTLAIFLASKETT